MVVTCKFQNILQWNVTAQIFTSKIKLFSCSIIVPIGRFVHSDIWYTENFKMQRKETNHIVIYDIESDIIIRHVAKKKKTSQRKKEHSKQEMPKSTSTYLRDVYDAHLCVNLVENWLQPKRTVKLYLACLPLIIIALLFFLLQCDVNWKFFL